MTRLYIVEGLLCSGKSTTASDRVKSILMRGKDYPMRRKTPCFSYGDIRRVHRIYASN